MLTKFKNGNKTKLSPQLTVQEIKLDAITWFAAVLELRNGRSSTNIDEGGQAENPDEEHDWSTNVESISKIIMAVVF